MAIMLGFALILFPFGLLAFVLLMGRVERPLSHRNGEEEIARFLDAANREELNTFVQEGTDSALRRFRNRLRPSRLRKGWRRAAS
jgi:hypothetical protein